MTSRPSLQHGEQIDALIDNQFDAALHLLQQLVHQASTVGHIAVAQETLYRAFRQRGLAATREAINRDEVLADPRYAPSSLSAAGQDNVVGVLPANAPGANERPIVLNGHIDVVPADPVSWWTYDPWGGEIVDGRMYGRGALDMKSGIVAALLAVEALQEIELERRFPVVIESVAEEECTGNGMLARRLASGPVTAALIIEPTGLATWAATPGVVWFAVTVTGKAAYVGRANDYVNAVETAAALIGRLKSQAVTALNRAFDDPRFAHLDQPLTLNVGKIEGGAWPSNVPLECTFTCRMSFPIGWRVVEAIEFVRRQITDASQPDPWLQQHSPTVAFPGYRAASWEGKPQSPWREALEDAHRDVLGSDLTATVFPGTADARYFTAEEEVLYYGPSGGNIHAPDEFVEIESVKQTARVIARLLVEWQQR